MTPSTERSFTPAERRAALWVVLIAAAFAAGVLWLDQAWGSPPLGAYDADGAAFAVAPGILDAQPAAG